MIIRRLLFAWRKDGYVLANRIAQREVVQALEELESEISNVIFEKDAKNKFVTSTVVELLLRDNAIRQSSMNTPASVPNPIHSHLKIEVRSNDNGFVEMSSFTLWIY